MIDGIQQSFENLEKLHDALTIKEIVEEDRSYLCAEFRPTCNALESIFEKLDESDVLTLVDILDDFWLTICKERYTKA